MTNMRTLLVFLGSNLLFLGWVGSELVFKVLHIAEKNSFIKAFSMLHFFLPDLRVILSHCIGGYIGFFFGLG